MGAPSFFFVQFANFIRSHGERDIHNFSLKTCLTLAPQKSIVLFCRNSLPLIRKELLCPVFFIKSVTPPTL